MSVLWGRLHWSRTIEGYCCFSLVVLYWVYGTYVPLKLIIIPYYQMGILKGHAVIVYCIFSIATVLSLARATFTHPGRPQNHPGFQNGMESHGWGYCHKCNEGKPPRAHHCKRCGHCVAKMDHHCPWINNCVGADNQFAFVQLTYYTIGLSTTALVFCLVKLYKFPPCPELLCDPHHFVFAHEKGILYSGIFMSCGVLIAMSTLSCGQHMNIALDVTTMETMFAENKVDFILSRPYKPLLHRYKNMCGSEWKLLWLWPFRRRYHFQEEEEEGELPVYNPLHTV